MSKIRTLKAEFFRDEDLSPNLVTKVLAAGLICTLADDEGRFKASTGVIRGEIFTHDHVNDEEITDALTHLEETGFIRLYQVNSKRFGLISNWKRHQPVPPTRFIASTLPPAPKQAPRKQGAGTPQAPDKQGASGKERKGIGREEETEGIGIGGESEGRVADATSASPLPKKRTLTPSPDEQRVFDAWTESLPPSTQRELTPQRLGFIRGALTRAPVEDCVDAVKGWRWDDWPGRLQNNDLDDCLRPSNLERFRDWERGISRPGSNVPANNGRREHPTDARVRELQQRAATAARQEASHD